MNEKFYSLPAEKQQRILEAGFLVFSQNSYERSPTRQIADAAGISKALLFHYFQNKKELYLFLWDTAARRTLQYLTRYGCYEPTDLFEMMERGMRAKLEMMRAHPHMTAFVVKAFYEKNPDLRDAIQQSYRAYFGQKAQQALTRIHPEDFVPGLDLKLMYREMYLASLGYLWEIVQRDEPLQTDRLEADFDRLLRFWKSIYLRKEGTDGKPRNPD